MGYGYLFKLELSPDIHLGVLLGIYSNELKSYVQDFPGGTVDKNLPANAGDTGLISCLERFHTEGFKGLNYSVQQWWIDVIMHLSNP